MKLIEAAKHRQDAVYTWIAERNNGGLSKSCQCCRFVLLPNLQHHKSQSSMSACDWALSLHNSPVFHSAGAVSPMGKLSNSQQLLSESNQPNALNIKSVLLSHALPFIDVLLKCKEFCTLSDILDFTISLLKESEEMTSSYSMDIMLSIQC